jgi:hypothetical protein
MRQVEAGAGVGERLIALGRVAQQPVCGIDRRHGQPVIVEQRLERARLCRGGCLWVEMRTIAWVHGDIDETETLGGNLAQRNVERIEPESERRAAEGNGRLGHYRDIPLGVKSTFPVSPRSKRS